MRLRAITMQAERRQRSIALCWLLSVLLCCIGSKAQTQPTEHQLKAAVIGNLAKFVNWPGEQTGESIAIGILGHDPFGSDLELVLKDMKVKGKPFSFKRSENVSDLLSCQVIFLSSQAGGKARELAERAGNLPILTVGEDAHFLKAGGAVSMDLEGRRIQLSINLSATEKAHLTVNPQLLRLAKVIKGKNAP